MTTLARRPGSPLGEMFDWLDALPSFPRRDGSGFLRVEDFTDGDEYVVRAELPGIDPDQDVAVTLTDDILTIRAERREEQRDKHHSEFHYGVFERSITVPHGIAESDVKATYADGVLEVRVPGASSERRTASIPVTRAAS
jgi:HSP20 family molecular chaperone IbpA